MPINEKVYNKLTEHFYKNEYKLSMEAKKLLIQYTDSNWAPFAFQFYQKVKEQYPEKRKDLNLCIKELKRYLKQFDKEPLSQEQIDIFLNSLNILTLPTSLVTYRGTRKELITSTSIIKSTTTGNNKILNKGDIITNLVPWSTSISMEHASCFAVSSMLEIHLPKNTFGIWLEPISLLKEEYEILLPSNMDFIVTDTNYNEDIDCEFDSKRTTNYFVLKYINKPNKD